MYSVTLRSHHITRLAHFFNLANALRAHIAGDRRYTPQTADRVADFYQRLFDAPETIIYVQDRPDDVCALCDNFRRGICQQYTIESLSQADAQARFHHNIRDTQYTVEKAKLLQDTFFRLRI